MLKAHEHHSIPVEDSISHPIFVIAAAFAAKQPPVPRESSLTVGLLEARAGTVTTELLGLAPPVVGDEECAVVLDEGLLELVLGVLVDELLVVGDDGLGDGLADGVDLRGVTTTGDADADVDVSCARVSVLLFCLFFVAHARGGLALRGCVGVGVRTELVEAEDEDGLVDLEAEDLGLDKGKGLSVDLDKTLTGLCDASSVRCAVVFACAQQCCARARGGCGAYLAVGDSGGGLLLAEALHGLGGHFERLWLVRARSWEVRAVDLTFERLRDRGRAKVGESKIVWVLVLHAV
jgi:hypothetical protein